MQKDNLSPLNRIYHYPDNVYSFMDETFVPDWIANDTYCASVVGWCRCHHCAVIVPLQTAGSVFCPMAIDDQECGVCVLGLAHRKIDSVKWHLDWQTLGEIERLSLEEGWFHFVLRAHTDMNEGAITGLNSCNSTCRRSQALPVR